MVSRMREEIPVERRDGSVNKEHTVKHIDILHVVNDAPEKLDRLQWNSLWDDAIEVTLT